MFVSIHNDINRYVFAYCITILCVLSMYSYFRHYAGPTKLYMNDERLSELPSGDPPPKGVLNSTPTPEHQAYFTSRKNLIKGWMRRRMFDPTKTWGKAATDDDKVEMVTTLNSQTYTYTCHTHDMHTSHRCSKPARSSTSASRISIHTWPIFACPIKKSEPRRKASKSARYRFVSIRTAIYLFMLVKVCVCVYAMSVCTYVV